MRRPLILLFTILISCLAYSQQSEINKLTEEYYNSLFYKISSNIKNTNIVAAIKDDKLTLKVEQKTDMTLENQTIGKETINASKGFCHDLIIMIYDTEEKRQYFKQNELKVILFDWTYVDRYYEKRKLRFTLSNSEFLSLGFPFLEYEFVEKLKKE
ncbi:MAG: hypothetical protein V7719_09600 [Psychroserpens sp.]|uniref:hypothetical protein n=1 Tax=Psychroserpens sp. TaxID=2020870 RepID=UPI003002E71A